MKVIDVMTKDVRTCKIHDHLDCAARVMWDEDVGCVPVVDQDARLAGIVTDRDACMAAYTQGLPLAAIPVTRAMARPVITCRSQEDLAAAERLMQQHQIRRLPVVDDRQHLVGILSLNDIALAAARERTKPARDVGSEEVAVTLATIGEPRRARPTPARASSTPTATGAVTGTGTSAGSAGGSAAGLTGARPKGKGLAGGADA